MIKTIHCNRDYRGMMEKVMDDIDVKIDLTDAQDHVPEAEQKNWTIKKQI